MGRCKTGLTCFLFSSHLRPPCPRRSLIWFPLSYLPGEVHMQHGG